MKKIEKPLITFALFTYNQEKFVREAIEGALSQAYSPLQIILSDDCSSDRTFEIIQEMVTGYVGPHEILVNRNEKNLGIGGHINSVMNEALGDLIVVAAGDDISSPNRTERLVHAWSKAGMVPDSLCSSMVAIGENVPGAPIMQGKPFVGTLSKGIDSYFDGLQGATHAWTSRMWRTFGPLLPGSVCEDRIIPIRSHLLGGSLWVDEPLVEYRIHKSNVSHFNTTPLDKIISVTAEIHRRNSNISENYVKDLQVALVEGLEETEKLQAAIIQSNKLMRVSKLKSEFALTSRISRLRIVTQVLRIDLVAGLKMMISALFPALYEKSQRKNILVIS